MSIYFFHLRYPSLGYRHPSPRQLSNSQLADGIELEIRSYQNPLFKPKGYAID